MGVVCVVKYLSYPYRYSHRSFVIINATGRCNLPIGQEGLDVRGNGLRGNEMTVLIGLILLSPISYRHKSAVLLRHIG